MIKEKNLILLGTNSDLVSIIKLNIEYDPLSKIQNVTFNNKTIIIYFVYDALVL